MSFIHVLFTLLQKECYEELQRDCHHSPSSIDDVLCPTIRAESEKNGCRATTTDNGIHQKVQGLKITEDSDFLASQIYEKSNSVDLPKSVLVRDVRNFCFRAQNPVCCCFWPFLPLRGTVIYPNAGNVKFFNQGAAESDGR